MYYTVLLGCEFCLILRILTVHTTMDSMYRLNTPNVKLFITKFSKAKELPVAGFLHQR